MIWMKNDAGVWVTLCCIAPKAEWEAARNNGTPPGTCPLCGALYWTETDRSRS